LAALSDGSGFIVASPDWPEYAIVTALQARFGSAGTRVHRCASPSMDWIVWLDKSARPDATRSTMRTT